MTHPFHPLRGREFELVDFRQAWGENRVYFHDDHGRLSRMPASWTDMEEPDVRVLAADGQADLRADDLVRLALLVASVRQ